MPAITILAPAKINLCLHITGKRADGYHLLQSLVVFTEFGDSLTIEPAGECSLYIVGEFATGLTADEDNLALRAAKLLQRLSGVPAGAKISLQKNIPVGAGLGGGSSDAAAALKALSRLWGIDNKIVQQAALQLGSDVPVCLLAQSAWVEGVGERVKPVMVPSEALLLVNPRIPLLTKEVFARFKGEFTVSRNWPVEIESSHNDLEKPAISLVPVIADVLAHLRSSEGCKLSRMSGSGATCFGLFADAVSAKKAQAALPKDWWSVVTKIKEA